MIPARMAQDMGTSDALRIVRQVYGPKATVALRDGACWATDGLNHVGLGPDWPSALAALAAGRVSAQLPITTGVIRRMLDAWRTIWASSPRASW